MQGSPVQPVAGQGGTKALTQQLQQLAGTIGQGPPGQAGRAGQAGQAGRPQAGPPVPDGGQATATPHASGAANPTAVMRTRGPVMPVQVGPTVHPSHAPQPPQTQAMPQRPGSGFLDAAPLPGRAAPADVAQNAVAPMPQRQAARPQTEAAAPRESAEPGRNETTPTTATATATATPADAEARALGGFGQATDLRGPDAEDGPAVSDEPEADARAADDEPAVRRFTPDARPDGDVFTASEAPAWHDRRLRELAGDAARHFERVGPFAPGRFADGRPNVVDGQTYHGRDALAPLIAQAAELPAPVSLDLLGLDAGQRREAWGHIHDLPARVRETLVVLE